jgi:hypothetical protein
VPLGYFLIVPLGLQNALARVSVVCHACISQEPLLVRQDAQSKGYISILDHKMLAYSLADINANITPRKAAEYDYTQRSWILSNGVHRSFRFLYLRPQPAGMGRLR